VQEQDHNLRIAEAICEHFAWDGQTYKEGDFVALLGGAIVAVADNPDAAIKALRMRDPDPRQGMVIEVHRPEADIIR
jgi:hypothetical protein